MKLFRMMIAVLFSISMFAEIAMAQNKVVVVPLSSASASSGTNLVKDSDGSVIGKVIGVDGNSRWTIINTKNYLVGVDATGWPKGEVVYFTSAGCTGTPMLTLATSGSATPSNSNPIYGKQGYVFTETNQSAMWYIAPGTAVSTGQAYLSRYLSSGCQNTSDSTDAILAISNDENVTGVPNTGYGSVSLQ